MLRECIYGECAHEQHVRRTVTLTLTHTITAYSVSGNVVRVFQYSHKDNYTLLMTTF